MDQASPRNLSNTPRSSADDVRLIADMRWLGALAERLVQDPGLAEDACQDAWLHAIRTEGAAQDRTLLFRSVRRVLYRYWRGWPTDQPEDLVFIRGEGVALRTWTVAEIRALPVDPDGVRHLEAPAGATVRGTVTMESGLPIPAGVELHYTMRGPAGTPARVFPIGMEPEGSAPIAADGAFVISGLPAGLLVTHMRDKSRSLRATPTSPDHLVEVPSSGEVLTRVVIPASPRVVTLNVSWGDRIDLLLFADLYRLNDDYDGPYAERPAPRELVAQRHWMLSGEETPLLFAPGALVDGQPYLLRIGLDVDRRIERLITFHGEAPRLDHTFTEAAMAEHPPSNQGPPSTAADDYRRRAAREVGAHITLRATTP